MYELHVGSISEKSTMHMYYNQIHAKCSITESMPLRSTQSTLKQKLMRYSKILPITTGECDY